MKGRTNPSTAAESRTAGGDRRPPSSLMARLKESSSSSSLSLSHGSGGVKLMPPQGSCRPTAVAGRGGAAAMAMGGRSSSTYVGRSSLAAAASTSRSSGARVNRYIDSASAVTTVVVDAPPPPTASPSTTPSTTTAPTPPSTIVPTRHRRRRRLVRILNAPPPPLSSTPNRSINNDDPRDRHADMIPYYMCTKNEAEDRMEFFELSPFEYRDMPYDAPPPSPNENDDHERVANHSGATARGRHRIARPSYDPRYVVKKYRRSAAGGGTSSNTIDDDDRSSMRTIEQLDATMDYLLRCVFVHRSSPPPTPPHPSTTKNGALLARDANEIDIWEMGDDEGKYHAIGGNAYGGGAGDGNIRRRTYGMCDVVGFVDDRIRAVQKDLVTLLGNLDVESVVATRRTARDMQTSAVRYSILTSYLLSDMPSSKYEMSFGLRALRSALTCHATLCSEDVSVVGHRGCGGRIGGERRGRGRGINVATDDEDDPIEHGEREGGRSGSRVRDGRLGRRGDGSPSSSYSRRAADARARDEMIAYAAILHSSAVIRRAEEGFQSSTTGATSGMSLMEDGGSGWGALLLQTPAPSSSSRRGLVSKAKEGGNEEEEDEEEEDDDRDNVHEEYPRWKWALEMACAAQEGNYQRYFSLLDSGPVDADETLPNNDNLAASTVEAEDEKVIIDRARFLVLSRCCASHSLNFIRLGQLRRYNQTFGKGEKVPMSDIAMLLRFIGSDDDENGDSIREATEFCRDAGLPIIEINDNGDDSKKISYVVMKSVPICIKGDDSIRRMCRPGRMNDAFVFGTRFIERDSKWHNGSVKRNGVESSSSEFLEMRPQQGDGPREDIVVDDWEDRDEEFMGSSLAGAATNKNFPSSFKAQMDEDGVLIPPSNVLRNLVG